MAAKFSSGKNQKYITQLRTVQRELPVFLQAFFRGIAESTSVRTRLAYAYDLKLFFTFMLENRFTDMDAMRGFDISVLDRIEPEDLERYMEHLSYYIYTGNDQTLDRQNGEHGKARKLAAVRTMYSYFYKKRRIERNPSELVEFPKIHEKDITRLDVNEVAVLLDEVDSGKKLTAHQQLYHARCRIRDLAIITLLLGTGMRVSECVGIDLDDIDFDINGVRITRKGGNEVSIYFGAEVEDALRGYLYERELMDPVAGHEKALFLSLHRRRITDRAVQNLVKKYARIATPIKRITPHKLRSTFGTNLYRESGDIYLVADALGHSDVNTTKKHYAQMEDSRRRKVVQFIKLREEGDDYDDDDMDAFRDIAHFRDMAQFGGMDVLESLEGIEGIEDTEGAEDTENTEGIEDTEDTEGIEGIEDTEDTEGIENAEDTEGTEGTENTEGIEDTEDIDIEGIDYGGRGESE